MKKKCIIFIGLFFLFLLFSILQVIDPDIIWAYGFSYNISQGLIPYKDFNMVIGPLYSILFSIPMIFFGNHLILYKIMHALFYSSVLTIFYDKLNRKTIWLALLLFTQLTFCWYNAVLGTLIALIMFIEDSNLKYKNIFIGLIIGFIMMTKHNIALPLVIVYFFTSKKKITSLISISIPVLITVFYLMLNKALLGYINFCYLGMGNFLSNLLIDIPTLIILIGIGTYIIKKYKNTKDNKILYVLSSMIFLFPLLEQIHLLSAIIPLAYYILRYEENKNTIYILKIFIIVGLLASPIVTLVLNAEINLDNDFLKYNIVQKGENKKIKDYSKYLDKIEGKNYLLISKAYIIKLYRNQTTDFYDLINTGNLGKDEKYFIDKMEKNCQKEKCTFILDEIYFLRTQGRNQMSKTFKDFVISNYKYVETLPTGDRVYTNEKE